MIEVGLNGSNCPGGSVGFLNLSQNLSFAENHGVETRSDTEQVTHCVLFTVFVQVRIQSGVVKLKILAKKSAQVCATVPGLRQQLDAVASAQNKAFVHTGMMGEALEGVG